MSDNLPTQNPEVNKQKEVNYLRSAQLMSERTQKEIADRGNKPTLMNEDPAAEVRKLQNQISQVYADKGIAPATFTKKDLEVDRSQYAINNAIAVSTDSKGKALTSSKSTTEQIINQNNKKYSFVLDDVEVDDDDIPYDVVPLPSKGECYKVKKSGLVVSYLTASDEDRIMQPALYKDGLIYTDLLKRKIKDKTINPDNLIPSDRDAIILWLRLTGYGKDYEISVLDPQTKEYFDTIVDLNTIGFKPFTLKGDENGLFSFTLPIKNSNGEYDVVKFKYLTIAEEREFLKFIEDNNSKVKGYRLTKILGDLNELLDNYQMGEDEHEILTNSKKSILNVLNSIDLSDDDGVFSKIITHRMMMQIKEFNGSSDLAYIEKKCKTMRAGNSLALREYIINNEPRVNFDIEVSRPESLGGGSFTTTFPFDDFIFFNTSIGRKS